MDSTWQLASIYAIDFAISLHLIFLISVNIRCSRTKAPAWFATQILTCQSLGKSKYRRKICHHFDKLNVRYWQVFISNQMLAKKIGNFCLAKMLAGQSINQALSPETKWGLNSDEFLTQRPPKTLVRAEGKIKHRYNSIHPFPTLKCRIF